MYSAIANPSSLYTRMIPYWKLADVLMGGTKDIRNSRLLIQHEREKESDYECRLRKSTLTPFYKNAVNTCVSRLFQKPVFMTEVQESRINDLRNNIDFSGTDLTTFSSRVFQKGLTHGFTHIFVDMPQKSEARNAKEEAELRPYFVHLRPEQVIDVQIDSFGTVTSARIIEDLIEFVDFKEVHYQRLRYYTPGHVDVWENYGEGWLLNAELSVDMSIDFVPIVTYYTDYQGHMRSIPPFDDLAHKNMEHYNSSSEQSNALTISRFPILHISGVAQNDLPTTARPGPDGKIQRGAIEIAPNKIIHTSSPDSKITYIEPTGAAIGAGRQSILDLEAQMDAMGASLMIDRTGTQTATEKAINTSESMSDLKRMAVDLSECLTNCFEIAAKWIGYKLDESFYVSVNTDFAVAYISQQELAVIQDANVRNKISDREYMHQLQQRGVLTDSYDFDKDQDYISTQAPDLSTL